ncbi:phenylacetic acid degradation protein [Rhizobium sp. Root149]|uniref:PaaI family thioesterase n=1 Tax=Rhizobium sp. Root149 TaxID=1736473 RepID=UPI000713AD1F|nr:PaaI family thioesterase [Rhizobium sp. Root149]KQZ57939.1 phenylacetic acid degradation protein [Rhizobium sp. Root149]
MTKTDTPHSHPSHGAQSLPLTGLDYVAGLAAGIHQRPPMADLLPFTLMPPELGAVEIRACPEQRFLNTLGTVHGGWSMTMLDTAMALAAHTLLEPEEWCPTLETAVKFIRPIAADCGELRISARVVARSRMIITLEGRIETLGGKVHAHGTSTCVVTARTRG